MSRVANFFWVLAVKYFVCLFGFLTRFVFRLKAYQIAPSSSVALAGDDDDTSKKENFESFLPFRFQNADKEDSVFMGSSVTQDSSKYEVALSKEFRGFMEEPEITSFKIQELFVNSNDSPKIHDGNIDFPFCARKISREFDSEIFLVGSENSYEGSDEEDFQGFNLEAEDSEVETLCSGNVSEIPQISSTEGISIVSHKIDSVTKDDFLDYYEEELELKNSVIIDEKRLDFPEKIPNPEENTFEEYEEDEYIELEPNFQSSTDLGKNFPLKELGRVEKEETSPDRIGKLEEPTTQVKSWVKSSDYEDDGGDDDDDDDGFDILLKHQDLIEQMKMEMKSGRSKGLPTILEESETPKMVEDLKPLKIDEELDLKDRLEQIQMIYKGYSDKMRKLDILNYQTLHAISFLQLKDPLHQAFSQRSSVSAIKSLLLPSLWPCKLRRIYADPTLKSITELHRDLEMVYVGQACLSWEILLWQYGKAKELSEYDPQGYLQCYNQVASEFQQFQVLVQRFIENEPFQGPRVQNYAKNRLELRSLLLVPAIRDDCLKDGGVEEENAVSITKLTEIIDESIRVFWDFIHADKDEASVFFKGLQACKSTRVGLQDPSDSGLLIDIRTSLQKKEKRLKDIVRSGNCIVRKFQKHQQGRMDHQLLVAQVELKLISRVLNTSKLTTQQLVWCRKKLDKIKFCNREIHVEPSFLLFPS